MRRLLVLIIVVIVLVVVALWVAQRPRRKCAGGSQQIAFDSSRQAVPNAKVDMILSEDSKLLSYSIVLKDLKKDVESVHFAIEGQDIFQASGPRNLQQEGSEVIIHGLWREKSRVPITEVAIQALKDGKMVAVVRFQDQTVPPFRIQLAGKK